MIATRRVSEGRQPVVTKGNTLVTFATLSYDTSLTRKHVYLSWQSQIKYYAIKPPKRKPLNFSVSMRAAKPELRVILLSSSF